MKKVISPCIYCGCGCNLNYHVDKNKVVKISGVKEDNMSEGKPCIKGLTLNEVASNNRINYPLVRKNGKLVKASWDEAINTIYEKVRKVNPSDVFMNGSGKITNEENLLLYKLGQTVLKTNNIDSCCGRLCHISTITGMKDCFGATNLTDVSKLDEIDTLFVIGSNPANNYPVFWNKVLKRKKDIKIISIQPMFNLTSQFGDHFVKIEPGTEVALLNGIMKYLIDHRNFDKSLAGFSDFNLLKKTVKKYTSTYVSKHCGVSRADFIKLCKMVADSERLGMFHGMGLTQHLNSMRNIHSLLNLTMLKDAEMLVLRGEINVQGVGDVYSSNVELLSQLWGEKLKPLRGNLVKSLLLNPVKVAFLTEFNPAQSLPNLNKVHPILEKIFLVYMGSYMNKTCEFADVILPIPALFETSGTITNGEQRVRLCRPVIKTKGKEILEICQMLSKKFGLGNFDYGSSKEIFEEIVKVNPVYGALDPEEVYSTGEGFIQQEMKFKRLIPEKFKGADERRSKKFPFILTTFREKHHFLTSEVTDASKTLNKLDKDRGHIFISSKDANDLGLKDEEKVRVVSKVGEIEGLVRVSKKMYSGLIATRFHYKEMLVNKLFASEFDKTTYIPNYKCVAVRVEKI